MPRIWNHDMPVQKTVHLVKSVLVAAVTLLVGGCGGAAKNVDQNTQNANRPAPSQVIEQMVDTYRNAAAYHDTAIVLVSYLQQGKIHEESHPLTVSFVRPNQLSVKAYTTTVKCDGKQIFCRVSDETTNDMDQQTIVRPAPKKLRVADLLDDPLLFHFLNGKAIYPVPLDLLLDDAPLNLLLRDEFTKELLDDQPIDGFPCFRVQATSNDGQITLWVDQGNHVLRRFGYEAAATPAGLSAEDVSELRFSVEFHGAEFSPPESPDVFAFTIPQDAKIVPHFVTLPPPPPSDRIGRRPESFSFVSVAGPRVTQGSLDGKIVALLWFMNQPLSEVNARAFDSVRKKFESDRAVEFLLVCTEPSVSSNDQLQQLVDRWGARARLVRDLEPHGSRTFGIEQVPTLVVLNARGEIQFVDVLNHPNLEQNLTAAITRLKQGDDLAAELRREYLEQVKAYLREIAELGNSTGEKVAHVPIAEKSDPQHVQLTQLWNCTQLKAPGNVLVIAEPQAGGAARILIHDGWRSIVELNPQGQVAARHELDLPPNTAVTYLRTAVDGKGKRFYLASEILGQQLHLFDENWRRLLSYPDSMDSPHPGMRDVQLFDLNADGQLEIYVGFWDDVGVQQLSLDGRRTARNRVMPQVLSLTPTEPNDVGWRKLLVTDDRGVVLRMNQFLLDDVPITVDGHAIHNLFAANFQAEQSAMYCGVSFLDDKTTLAVGIDRQMQALWTMTLPTGAFDNQIQFVTSGRVVGDSGGWWFIARPDGSIHIKSDDGQIEDHLNYGQSLTGIAVARIADKPVLIISTAAAVTAWRLDPNEAKSPL